VLLTQQAGLTTDRKPSTLACGNAAIRTNLTIDSFERPMLEHVASEIQREVSFGVGRAGSHTRDWGSAKKRWRSTVLWRR
jgi:RNA-splicing ligase RtcB